MHIQELRGPRRIWDVRSEETSVFVDPATQSGITEYQNLKHQRRGKLKMSHGGLLP